MKVEDIKVGHTYEGREEEVERTVMRLWLSHSGHMQVEYFDLLERKEWNTALIHFASWAQTDITPHVCCAGDFCDGCGACLQCGGCKCEHAGGWK